MARLLSGCVPLQMMAVMFAQAFGIVDTRRLQFTSSVDTSKPAINRQLKTGHHS
jgi:hypothetical protein